MKNLLLGIAAVAMVTNAMAVVPVQKGELKADEAVKQVMLKRADGRMQAVAPSQMSLRAPQKAPVRRQKMSVAAQALSFFKDRRTG